MDATTREQISRIELIAKRIWSKFTPFQVQERLMSVWDELETEHGNSDVRFKPLYPLEDDKDTISCGILGSGGFSTGREELERAQALTKELGRPVMDYCAVITNRSKSMAGTVAAEFGLPYLCVDYSSWRKENDITGSTKLFGFLPGEEPARELLEDRIKIKKAFDGSLHDSMLEALGRVPESVSLRGYDFILTDRLFSDDTEVDNTHPANLIIKESTGEPAYAGWQEAAYNKMREDGLTSFPTTLIRVGYIGGYSDLIEVDAGEMLAISPGNPGEYHKIEDHYLLTLKATGLLPYFWGISEKPGKVQYMTKDGQTISTEQQLIIVGDVIKSGRDVFGQAASDLEIFTRVLGI